MDSRSPILSSETLEPGSLMSQDRGRWMFQLQENKFNLLFVLLRLSNNWTITDDVTGTGEENSIYSVY